MQEEFLGLPMKKGQKIRIIVSLVVASICLVAYIVTGFFKQEEVIVVQMPYGNLSASIYDAQNMTYVETEGLDEEFVFEEVPFSIDVIKADKASVGNADIFLQDPYHFYFTVAEETEDMAQIIKEDLTNIISIGASSDETNVSFFAEQEGYINGCSATFYVAEIVVNEYEPYYLCVYRLHVDESIYASTKDIVVGVMAPGYNTENLANLQQLAQICIGTLQYDKYKDEELKKLQQESVSDGE